MNIIPTTSHPAWCAPRACKAYLGEDGAVSYEHRETAGVLRSAAMPEIELTVRRTQVDDRSTCPWLGDVNVTLQITDTASRTPRAIGSLSTSTSTRPTPACSPPS